MGDIGNDQEPSIINQQAYNKFAVCMAAQLAAFLSHKSSVGYLLKNYTPQVSGMLFNPEMVCCS